MKILKPARSWRGADILRSILLHWRALPCEAAAGFQVAAEWKEQPHSRDSTQTLFFRFPCTFAMVFVYFYTLQKTPTLCIYFYSDFRSLMIRKVRFRCKNHLVARLCCVCVWSKNNPDAENIGLGREKKTSKKTTKNLQRSEIKKSHNLCGPFFTLSSDRGLFVTISNIDFNITLWHQVEFFGCDICLFVVWVIQCDTGAGM